MRDGLSILDHAFAWRRDGSWPRRVRAMLGLADRGRIFDLLEAVFMGDAAQALRQLAELYEDGADPEQALGDLAEAVHAITLVKVSGAEVLILPRARREQARALDLAWTPFHAVLARAWQMLLKGHDEARSSPRPLAAADMVLVRLAYAADLPPPGELMRRLVDGAERGSGRGRASRNAQ